MFICKRPGPTPSRYPSITFHSVACAVINAPTMRASARNNFFIIFVLLFSLVNLCRNSTNGNAQETRNVHDAMKRYRFCLPKFQWSYVLRPGRYCLNPRQTMIKNPVDTALEKPGSSLLLRSVLPPPSRLLISPE
jgi:hypothetical protein